MEYDQTKIPPSYDAGRGYSPKTLALWLDVIARAAPSDCKRVLDLGCGTGRFSKAISEHLKTEVIAIDPSETMLAEARKKKSPRVLYERASGENIPLANNSVDMVFMSMVFHHLNDRDKVVAECHRVLRASGRVAMRAVTAEYINQFAYVPFFPSSAALARLVVEPRAILENRFKRLGFTPSSYEVVQSPVADSWSDYFNRLTHRADSVLVQVPDDEFRAGLDAVRRRAATRPEDEPVLEPVDFFVFER